MTHFTKIFIAATFITAATTPALAQPAAPDTSPQCEAITATVYFAADQAELSKAAMAALEAQAEGIEGCTVSTIEATAVSTDGSTSLSEARSTAVISALADLGIASADTVTTISQAPEGRLISTARQVELKLGTLPELVNS